MPRLKSVDQRTAFNCHRTDGGPLALFPHFLGDAEISRPSHAYKSPQDSCEKSLYNKMAVYHVDGRQQSCHFDYTNFFDTACTSRDCQDTLGENDSVFSKLCRKFSVTWRGGEVEALIWDRYRNKSTTIHQKGLKVRRSALLTKFFYRFLIAKNIRTF